MAICSTHEAYRLLENISSRPIDTGSFPTHFGVILRLKNVMSDPDVPYKDVIDVLKTDVVVSSKIVRSANAASFHGHGEIKDIDKAVFRLGLTAVRRISLGVAMSQLSHSRETLVFASLSRLVWLHSLRVAASAHVIAREFTKVNPDEAFFTGLVLNIGAFYLLYKASSHAELHGAQEDLKAAVMEHYLALSRKIVSYLEMPTSMIEAIDIKQYQGQSQLVKPRSLREIIHVSNELASCKFGWYLSEHELEVSADLKAVEPMIDLEFNKILDDF